MAEDLTPAKLESMMVAVFGKDWKRKTLVGPTSVFPLIQVYDECGFDRPGVVSVSASASGLFQIDYRRGGHYPGHDPLG